MQFSSTLSLALGVIGAMAAAKNLDYAGSIHALSYGNVEMQSNAGGEVWFKVTGFAPDKLPHIQNDVGLYTMDNLESLKTVAGLGQVAAKEGKWGDVVYLHNVFSMNAHADYAKASSTQLRDGLLVAVTKADKSGIDSDLIDLYVKTSSSPFLAKAFNALRTTPATSITRRSVICDNAHTASKSACRSLAESIRSNASGQSGGPRAICIGGCCISWSRDATFQVQNLYPAANDCINICGGDTVSCRKTDVNLQGTTVTQCLSNRANGCS